MPRFSINRAENDRYLRRDITEDTEGTRLLLSLTWEIIDAGDHYRYFRGEIYDVIYQEANRCFSGEITAEKAAEYIQNRVSIYLAEQG